MMTDQRHEDATRDEPPNGETREIWIKSRLKSYLRGPSIAQLTSREETATGRALSRFFTDYLEIRKSLTNDGLTPVQRMILWWQYGPDDLTIAEIARRLNLHYVTVYRYRHAALEYLIRVYYDEPDYVLPHRTYERERAAVDCP